MYLYTITINIEPLKIVKHVNVAVIMIFRYVNPRISGHRPIMKIFCIRLFPMDMGEEMRWLSLKVEGSLRSITVIECVCFIGTLPRRILM